MADPVKSILFDMRRKKDQPMLELLNTVAERTPCDDATGIARKTLHAALLKRLNQLDADIPQPGVG